MRATFPLGQESQVTIWTPYILVPNKKQGLFLVVTRQLSDIHHREGPNAAMDEGKGSLLGKRYAETVNERALAAKTPAQLKEPRERRVTIVGNSNMHRAEAVITKRVGKDQ